MNIYELETLISENTCAFLFGNGFSRNFDDDFGNVYNNLYDAHKFLVKNAELTTSSGTGFRKKLIDNYNSVIRELKYNSKTNFYNLFTDALAFANSIYKNNELIEELEQKKLIKKLGFGLSEFDIIKNICEIGNTKGVYSVNIENWTILVYFYHAIETIKSTIYKFPAANSFLLLLRKGYISEISINEELVLSRTTFNGFITYYRMLFAIAILANGKSIDIEKTNKLSILNKEEIKVFLNKFSSLMTLNYDLIVEQLTNREVFHIHGKYFLGAKRYVYYQSLSVLLDNQIVEFSDILLGDYFVFKAFMTITNNLSKKNFENDRNYEHPNAVFKRVIKDNEIKLIVIFGVNVENDYHILRDIMMEFYFGKIDEPKIVYCYYNDYEKEEFEETYNRVITYDKELSEYSRNIKRYYIKSQEIIDKFFAKK